MNLENKVALVTGASKGIGRAIALHLAAKGCHLALAARSKKELEAVKKECEKIGVRVLITTADLTKESEINSSVENTLQHFGRLDILINNAGIGHFHSISEMTTADWDAMFNLNIRGLFLMTRACLPYLKKQDESAVINISSLAGKNSFAGGGGYTATKHALMAFSRCLMLEERKNGLRVSVICPGSVDTGFGRGELAEDDPKKQRILKADDVAATVLHVLQMPPQAMISEVDMRPSNP
ncbi:SDR family NAD(P)-dependent oxidoreductase [candidate division KSB1 bacterium]|nr:SDR family NAD(P)-dependent oxidoreductase [candidate division KSB1 bacterium]